MVKNKKMSIKNIRSSFFGFGIDSVKYFVEKYMSQIVYAACFISIIAFLTVYALNKKNNRENGLLIVYYQAINDIRNDRNEDALQKLQNIYGSGYADENLKTISGIRMAELLSLNADRTEAVKIYKNIFNFKKNDDFLRNLSGLAALSILVDENNPQDYSEIDELIGNLDTPSNPVVILVHEQKGLFEIQRGNLQNGIDILNNLLLEDEIDEDTKYRVESVLELYKNESI